MFLAASRASLLRILAALALSSSVAACENDTTGKSPGPADGPSASGLGGTLYAPSGTTIVLQNNGGSDREVTVAAAAEPYGSEAFSFDGAASGEGYSVSIKSKPDNLTCQVYKGAAGTVPTAQGALRVGCEYTYDHVLRDGDKVGTVYGTSGATISGDGRYVVFVSSRGELAGASSKQRFVFWRDRLEGVVRLVTVRGGVEADGDSFGAKISADGQTVVFESVATNLVDGDGNKVSDVFVWSAADGAISRASVGPGGIEANGASKSPAISGDGKVIAFESNAKNLRTSPLDTNSDDVYRRDLSTGENTLVSVLADGRPSGGSAPSLSHDGRHLAFSSYFFRAGGDPESLWDAFSYDHASGKSTLATFTGTGAVREQGSESASRIVSPAISGDGRWLGYATTAGNVVDGDKNKMQDAFVVDMEERAVVRVSVATDGTEGEGDSPIAQGGLFALSHDGTWSAFASKANNLGVATSTTGLSNAFLHNRVTGETRAVSANTSRGGVQDDVTMSGDAAYVLFGSSEPYDARFDAASGYFAHYTGAAPAFFWPVD